jgi:hypothetical protein
MPSDQRKDHCGKSLATIFAMRSAIILAAAAAAVALAAVAHADPGCFDSSDPTCGGHSWNGPLRQTWDTPGYFGGWNNRERVTELCSPFTYQCQGVAPTP